MDRFRRIAVVAASVLSASAAALLWAEDSPQRQPPSSRLPEMFSIRPLGAERGSSVDVEILGQHLDGAAGMEVGGPGIRARVLESSSLRAKARLDVDPKAEPGVYTVRLTSALGVSNLLSFRVGAMPQADEIEPNDGREQAQFVATPGVVDGLLFPDEDKDFYRIHAAAGERLVMEVLAARNGSGLNAQMYLLDSSGARLAVAEDEAGVDPVLVHTFEKEGDYFVVVRGSYYVLNLSFPTGHPAYLYQFRVSSPPVLHSISPPTASPGTATDVEIAGTGLEAVTRLEVSDGLTAKVLSRSSDRIRASIVTPPHASGLVELRAISARGESESLRVLVAEALPTLLEREIAQKESPQAVTAPTAILGGIDQPGEEDSYSFTVSAPGAYLFEVQAGRVSSLLDSILTLRTAQGEELAVNDDGLFDQPAQGDSKIFYRFTEPGDYVLSVKQAVLDLHGPRYGYRLVARKAQPRFALKALGGAPDTPWVHAIDRIVANAGSTISIPVQVTWLEGLEADGTEIELRVEGLPPTFPPATCMTNVRKGKHEDNARYGVRVEIPVVVPEDGALANYPVRVAGTATAGGQELRVDETIGVSITGRYVMSSGSGIPRTLSGRYLSVVRPLQFTLRPEIGDERYPIRFTIQPGTSKTLPVTVLPAQQFPLGLEFSAENLPRGLTIERVETHPEAKQYVLHLKAASDGETGWFPVVTVLARDPSGGNSVAAPYFGLTVQ